MLLSTAYFPPVEYFALLARDFVVNPGGETIPSEVYIEACESYVKQTWRTRCDIMTSLGVETLRVPVVHRHGMKVSEVIVEYTTPWIIRTERAIDTAYRTSAFFEYYRDGLYGILEEKVERLFDLNMLITKYLLSKTGIRCNLIPTTSYAQEGTVPDDWRNAVHPKKPNTILKDLSLEKPYFQVFSGKYGFKSGLSVIDLLFNEGPDSISYLKNLEPAAPRI